MKLRFKHQQFQDDAVKAVCDVFTGQIKSENRFLRDLGKNTQLALGEDGIGFSNSEITLQESDMLKNLHEVQSHQNLEKKSKIERLNNRPVFTIEMETGTGKTYTYIKTMLELNKQYGWSKFIIVAPSIAIREGVLKTFETTADHFKEDYPPINFFVYNSANLTELDHFASDSGVRAMIINTQAFNSRGADSKRIRMKLDSFNSRRPIDVIAATRPIIIIDEPQSVLGTDKNANITRSTVADFNPLFFLNYSATHREDFNKVYRLDAVDAYQKQLVKKITVKGIDVKGGSATTGYLYLQKINTYPNRKPTATVVFEFNSKVGTVIRKKTKTLEFGDDIYVHSGELEAYRNGYKITEINAGGGYVGFQNGMNIYEGEVIGKTSEDDIRRIQIKETILSHLETERRLFNKGIKVLSLFFIDEVAKYKYYDETGKEKKGDYAKIFEDEFEKAVKLYLEELPFEEDAKFKNYLESFTPSEIHSGYFSIDKKGHAINSKAGKEGGSDDVSAYDLIMKNKERLLSFDEPVRFIFSHSALREGWDNPNVFQICTLNNTSADIKKRQEIGRGLRLAVDQNGIRQDAETLGENLVHDTNILTVIANESYDSFARSLQNDFDEILDKRPKDASASLFNGCLVYDDAGEQKLEIDDALAADIYMQLALAGIIDSKTKQLTDAYQEIASTPNKTEQVRAALDDNLKIYASDIEKILETVHDAKKSGTFISNARHSERLNLNQEKYASKKFHELWDKINDKTCYKVSFNEDELIERAVAALNKNLRVTKSEIVVTEGVLKNLGKDKIEMFREKIGTPVPLKDLADESVRFDLVSELSKSMNDGGTSLTRATIAKILSRIEPGVFEMFKQNPEEFIVNAINLINGEKAATVVEHIEYDKLNEKWDGGEIFVENEITGDRLTNLIDTPNHHLYDKLRYDSEVEKDFALALEDQDAVEVYVKLPKQFYIDTPMGHYNPDWAIAFHDDAGVKHIYFVAETKGVSGSGLDLGLKGLEKAKIECAKKHFEKISGGEYIYGVCDSYESLLNLVS